MAPRKEPFRVKLHDTTLPLSTSTDLTGATVTAFIRTIGAEGEVPATVPVNVTDATAGDFDLLVSGIDAGQFDLEVLVARDGEEVRIPSEGFDWLVVGENLDDPLALPYQPSLTLRQVIEQTFAAEADRVIPFAATALDAAAEAVLFAASTEFDANRAGESAFQSGQSAGYALGHRNAAQASAEAAATAVASIPSTFVSFAAAAKNPDLLIVGNIVRNANQAVTSADVMWPDGTPGTFTALTLSTAFPGAVDSYKITYGSPAGKTFTQPDITRNTAGAATTVPQIVVS